MSYSSSLSFPCCEKRRFINSLTVSLVCWSAAVSRAGGTTNFIRLRNEAMRSFGSNSLKSFIIVSKFSEINF